MPSELAFGAKGENLVRHDCVDLLRQAGLRPTHQRLVLGSTSVRERRPSCHRGDALMPRRPRPASSISLATVYNTLNQFTDAGLLRQIGIDGSKSYFDTNPTGHHHFFVDQEDRLLDVPEPGVLIDTLPEPLPGYEVAGVDVVVHLRRKQD